jgi:hypothetical protein
MAKALDNAADTLTEPLWTKPEYEANSETL